MAQPTAKQRSPSASRSHQRLRQVMVGVTKEGRCSGSGEGTNFRDTAGNLQKRVRKNNEPGLEKSLCHYQKRWNQRGKQIYQRSHSLLLE